MMHSECWSFKATLKFDKDEDGINVQMTFEQVVKGLEGYGPNIGTRDQHGQETWLKWASGPKGLHLFSIYE